MGSRGIWAEEKSGCKSQDEVAGLVLGCASGARRGCKDRRGCWAEEVGLQDAAGGGGTGGGGAGAEAGWESLAEKGGRGTLAHCVAPYFGPQNLPSPWSLPSVLAPSVQGPSESPSPNPSSAAVTALSATLPSASALLSCLSIPYWTGFSYRETLERRSSDAA